MPGVPTTELVPEEPEKLDLPDVPTKTPVAADAEIAPTKRKGFLFSFSYVRCLYK